MESIEWNKWLQKQIFILYVFRRYQSVDVTGNHSTCDAKMLWWLGQFRSRSVFTYFTQSAALLQAVLQAYAEPLQSGLVETRNWAVEIRNGLGAVLGPARFPSQMKCSKQTGKFYTIKHEVLIFSSLFIYCFFLIFSIYEKSLWSVVFTIVFLFRRGNEHFDVCFCSHSFHGKMEKTGPVGKNGWKMFILLQSSLPLCR